MIAIVHICDWCKTETRDLPVSLMHKEKLFEENPLNIVGPPQGAVEICKKCAEELTSVVNTVRIAREQAGKSKPLRCPGCDTDEMTRFECVLVGVVLGSKIGLDEVIPLLCEYHRKLLSGSAQRIKDLLKQKLEVTH